VKSLVTERKEYYLATNMNYDLKQVVYNGCGNKKNKKTIDDYLMNGLVYTDAESDSLYYIEYVPLTSNRWFLAYKVDADKLRKFEEERVRLLETGDKPNLSVFTDITPQYFDLLEHKLYQTIESLKKKELPLQNNSDLFVYMKAYHKQIK
jgi:hypothetical protein